MTAEKFLKNFNTGKAEETPAEYVQQAMIDFAKYHVKRALKVASENVKMYDANENNSLEVDEDGNHFEYLLVDKQSILNAYPLENIV